MFTSEKKENFCIINVRIQNQSYLRQEHLLLHAQQQKNAQVLGFLTPSTTLQLQSTSNSSIKLPLGAVVTYTCSRYDLLKQDRGDNLRVVIIIHIQLCKSTFLLCWCISNHVIEFYISLYISLFSFRGLVLNTRTNR